MINRTTNNANYYSNPENYEEITTVITDLDYLHNGKVYLKFDTDSYPNAAFWELNSENAKVAEANGFNHEVKIGDEITIVSAFGFITPGYFRTIVSVKKGDIVYIDQRVGVANQIKIENASYLKYMLWMIIPSLSTLTCWLVFYSLARRKRMRPS